MAIDFGALLTEDQKKSLLEQRLTQFAAEAYQHELNRQVAVAAGDEVSVENADKALAVLETAINVHQSELSSLSVVE